MSKRKRVVLNFQQKLEILQQLNEGKSGSILAKQYNVGSSTISDIKRNADAILQFVSNLEHEEQISEKKTRKTAQNSDLDSQAYKWYREQRKKGISPPDATICAKALEINKHLTNGHENFKASGGWLRHFKSRHGIKEPREESEENGANIGKVIRNVVKRGGYTLENVYNVDDGFLLWKSLPGYDKDRGVVTVIACANANGSHKLPLCVIGRDKKCKTETGSIIYKLKHKENFFQEWFEEVFLTRVKTRQQEAGGVGKILLVMDDASWHPHRDILIDKHLDIDIFTIPDPDPEIQPMKDELKRLKMIYRTNLLQFLSFKSPYPIKQFLEEFTMKESISIIGEAWDSILRTHIAQSWGRILSDLKNEECREDGISGIVTIARKIIGLDQCNFEDVTRWLESDSDDYYFFSTEEDEETDKDDASNLEAYQCLETAISWFVKQKECSNEQLSTLESLRDLAASKLCGNIKQET